MVADFMVRKLSHGNEAIWSNENKFAAHSHPGVCCCAHVEVFPTFAAVCAALPRTKICFFVYLRNLFKHTSLDDSIVIRTQRATSDCDYVISRYNVSSAVLTLACDATIDGSSLFCAKKLEQATTRAIAGRSTEDLWPFARSQVHGEELRWCVGCGASLCVVPCWRR